MQRPVPPGGGAGGRGPAGGQEIGFVEDEEDSPDEQSDSEESDEVEDGPHVPLSG